MDADHKEDKTGNGYLPLDTPSFPKWLDLMDFLLSRVIGALVVAFWWAVWTDSNMFQDNQFQNFGIAFALGPGMTLAVMIFQKGLKSIHSRPGFIVRHLIVVLYAYIVAFSTVNMWRWLWVLLDETVGVDYLAVSVTLGAGVVFLAATRQIAILVNAPSIVSSDLATTEIFDSGTFFNQKPGTSWHVADCLFTVLVIRSAATIVWRGWWELLDLILFPGQTVKSSLYSLIISHCLDVVLLLMTSTAKKICILCEERHWLLKIMFEDLIVLLHFASSVMFWRGIWALLDHYIKEQIIRFCVFHAGAFVILVLMFASTSMVNLDCRQDGALSDGQGVVNDNRYVTLTVQAYHRWKMGKRDIEACRLASQQEPVRDYNALTSGN